MTVRPALVGHTSNLAKIAMQKGTPSDPAGAPGATHSAAFLALCAGLLPVWQRHLATSRAQSETAVAEMLQAFSDIGPHIDMAERQSQQINDALVQADGGVAGLGDACERALTPLLQDANMSAHDRAALASVIAMVHRSVGALEQIAKPFQHETQMVAQQVERMYIGFQYQDRISQMMALLESDMVRLQETLRVHDVAVPELKDWLVQLESRYAMAEQRENHVEATGDTSKPATNETTFF